MNNEQPIKNWETKIRDAGYPYTQKGFVVWNEDALIEAINSLLSEAIREAVEKERERIERKIQIMIDENSHIANYYDTAIEIINLLKDPISNPKE